MGKMIIILLIFSLHISNNNTCYGMQESHGSQQHFPKKRKPSIKNPGEPPHKKTDIDKKSHTVAYSADAQAGPSIPKHNREESEQTTYNANFTTGSMTFNATFKKLFNTSDNQTIYEALYILKTLTIITFYIMIQVDCDYEDWYGQPSLYAQYKNFCFTLRLINNIELLDLILYKIKDFNLLEKDMIALFVKIGYEAFASIQTITNTGTIFSVTQRNFFTLLNESYANTVPQRIDGFSFDDDFFKELKLSLQHVAIITYMLHTVLVYQLTITPFILDYAKIPADLSAEVWASLNTQERKECHKTFWFKNRAKELFLLQQLEGTKTIAPTFDQCFTWLRQHASKKNIQEIIQHIHNIITGATYTTPPDNEFEEFTITRVNSYKTRKDMQALDSFAETSSSSGSDEEDDGDGTTKID